MFKTICQQEAVGCNTQGGVMVKSTPVSSLVVAQAELLFKLLIVSFNAPAHFGCRDQLHKRGMNGQRREPILGRFCLIYRPFDQQPLFCAWGAKSLLVTMRRPHSQGGEARRQFGIAPLTPGHRTPSVCAQLRIPDQIGHLFRCKPATVPEQTGHPLG
jgi:hypothetical protein